MRVKTFYKGLRAASAAALFFFVWAYGPLWQAVAIAATNQKTHAQAPVTPKSNPVKQSPEERFETALDSIKDNIGKAVAKANKGEDETAEINAVKVKKGELDALDAELKNGFAATEKKLKEAHLPQDILDRHAKFVQNYENNLSQLRTEIDDMDKAKTGSDRKARLKKVRMHLEGTRPLRRHAPLDPDKPSIKNHKSSKTRAPHLNREEFQKEYPSPKQNNRLAGWPELAEIVPENNLSKGKPIQLALNDAALFASDVPLSLGTPLIEQLREPSSFDHKLLSEINALSADRYELAHPLLAQAIINQPTADDLAETPEVQFTDDIRALATQLNNSPVKIFEWVKNNIEYVPSYGSIQGANMCLQSQQCNDMDTASLLLALLRVSNIPAHYVYGTIEVPMDKVENWTGGFTDPNSAASAIASGGIPAAGKMSGGILSAIRMEHVWVEAFIPYGNYRGAIMDQSLKTWIPLDGSFKQYTYTNGFDITSAVPFSQDDYLSQVQTQNAVHYYQSQIQNYLDANLPDTSIIDVKGFRQITQETYHFLPSNLPYVTVAVLGKYSAIPANMAATITFSLTDPTTGSNVSYTASTSDVAGKRVTVSYLPATSNDEALIANYGGFLYNVPAYMLNLVPVIKVEGVLQLTGEATTLGSGQNLTVQFTQPSGVNETINKNLIAGAYYAIATDLQGINENVLGKRNYKLTNSVLSETAGTLGNDDLIGEHLHILATTYFLANDKIYKSGAKLYNTTVTRTLSEGITSFTVSVSHLFGMSTSAMPSGINMDVAMDRVIVIAKDGNTNQEMAYMSIAGLVSSYNEHDIFEKIDGFASVSTVRALQVADANGITIEKINSGNIAQILPSLQVSADVTADIQNAINAGKEVTVPQTNVQINDWNGSGYIVKDLVTGSGSYMISGRLAGSDSTSQQDGMQIVELFKGPLGWVKNDLDPNTRGTIAIAAESEDGESDPDEGTIQNAIVDTATSPSTCQLTYKNIGMCTGLVYKAYAAAGIYLFGAVLEKQGGKYKDGLDIIWNVSGRYQSEILYNLVNAQKVYENVGVRMINNPPVLKGDVIFFKNTYVRDDLKDISDQGNTHVGIVLSGPDSEGNIKFAQALDLKKKGKRIYNQYGGQVWTNSKLNILLPDDLHNSILRLTPTAANAAQLFNGFGTVRNVTP